MSELPLISIYYSDVGEQGPRLGGGYFSARRRVTDIAPIAGGQMGTIQYKGRKIPVYQKIGWSWWETRRAALDPIKITYLH